MELILLFTITQFVIFLYLIGVKLPSFPRVKLPSKTFYRKWVVATVVLSLLQIAAHYLPFQPRGGFVHGNLALLLMWELLIIYKLPAPKPLQLHLPKLRNMKLDWRTPLLLLFIPIFLTFGFYALGEFMSVDEPKWLISRVPQYILAWKERIFILTFVNDKPGVIPALLASIPELIQNSSEQFQQSPEQRVELLSWWRSGILLFNGVILLVVGSLIIRTSKGLNTLLSLLLIWSLPILLGITRTVNPDATLWSASIGFLITFTLALDRKSTFLSILAGVLFGVALLSKFTVQVFYIYLLALLLLRYLTAGREEVLRDLRYLLIAFLSAFGLVMLLMPALFSWYWLIDYNIFSNPHVIGKLQPFITLFIIGFISEILLGSPVRAWLTERIDLTRLSLLATRVFALLLFGVLAWPLINFIFEIAPFSFHYTFYSDVSVNLTLSAHNALSAIFSAIPLALFLLILLSLFLISIGKFKKKRSTYLLSLMILIVAILGGTILSDRFPAPRYFVMLFPLLILLPTFVINERRSNWILLGAVLLLNIVALLHAKPYYLIYSNNIAEKHSIYFHDSWGLGGYEVSELLEKDYPELPIIWADREGFCDFYDGTCNFKPYLPFCEKNLSEYMLLSATRLRDFRSHKIFYLPETAQQWEYYLEESESEKVYTLRNNPSLRYELHKVRESDRLDCSKLPAFQIEEDESPPSVQ